MDTGELHGIDVTPVLVLLKTSREVALSEATSREYLFHQNVTQIVKKYTF